MTIPEIHTAPGDRIVTFFCTRNLYPVLPAAYNSLLAYNPGVHVFCFIEDDTLPFPVPANVTCVNVSQQTLFPKTGPNYSTKYTYMILLKAALTKIFPDADLALILDVDTITCDDISRLWNEDAPSNSAYFASVTEPEGSRIRGIPYPNFGITMLNLHKLRSTGRDDDIINLLNTKKFSYPEQDAFAQVCCNRFDSLDPSYNVTNFGFNITGNPSRTRIKHFAGFSNWADFDVVQYWLNHTTPPPRYVVYAGDHRVHGMMVTAAKSLLNHTRVDKIFFLTDRDDFGKLPDIIQLIDVSKQNVFPPTCPNILPWYSYMTTLRAGLTKILPEDIDTVLWLDPDTIVTGDISDIWNTEITTRYFAAVEEVRNHNHTLKPYFNAGVMLMNLRKFRDSGMDDKVIHEINTKKYEHLEQDVLNYLCFTHIRHLPAKYSSSFVSEPCTDPVILHFVSTSKPGFTQFDAQYKAVDWDSLAYVEPRRFD